MVVVERVKAIVACFVCLTTDVVDVLNFDNKIASLAGQLLLQARELPAGSSCCQMGGFNGATSGLCRAGVKLAPPWLSIPERRRAGQSKQALR